MIHDDLRSVILNEEFSDILGQEEPKKHIKSAFAMGRHIILVGPPGIGKTTLAKNLAKMLPELMLNDCEFHCDPKKPLCPKCRANTPKTKKVSGEGRFIRIQGSPDLSVEDILGDIDPVKALTFGPMNIESFSPGKIFKANNGILFFDEINRCSERLQNSLLQVLEEGHATLGAYTIDLPTNFLFIGTMNPEDTSTETLSAVFLDRFDVIEVGYPESSATEKEIVLRKGKNIGIEFPDYLLESSIRFVRSFREHPDIAQKPSVRASLGLFERAQSNAAINGNAKVTLQDIEEAIISVLRHRIRLKPSARYSKPPEKLISEAWQRFVIDNELSEQGGDP